MDASAVNHGVRCFICGFLVGIAILHSVLIAGAQFIAIHLIGVTLCAEYGIIIGADGLAKGIAQQEGYLAGGKLLCSHNFRLALNICAVNAAGIGVITNLLQIVAVIHRIGAVFDTGNGAAARTTTDNSTYVIAVFYRTGTGSGNAAAIGSSLDLTEVVAIFDRARFLANNATCSARTDSGAAVNATLYGACALSGNSAGQRAAEIGIHHAHILHCCAACNITKQTGIELLTIQTSNGVILTVKGAIVTRIAIQSVICIADGFPAPEIACASVERTVFLQHVFIDHDVCGQLGVSRGVTCVDIGRKPVQLAGGINQVVTLGILLRHLIAAADRADQELSFSACIIVYKHMVQNGIFLRLVVGEFNRGSGAVTDGEHFVTLCPEDGISILADVLTIGFAQQEGHLAGGKGLSGLGSTKFICLV